MKKSIVRKLLILSMCVVTLCIINSFNMSFAAEPNAEIHVSASGSDSGKGTVESPYLTIAKALEVVENNGTILLDDNVSMGVDNNITKNVTITSNGDNVNTLMRSIGSEGYCLIVKEGFSLTLENVIIDGNSDNNSYYPVIKVESGTLNIKNGGIVQNNNSHSDGAINLLNSTFNMSGGEIKNNISSMHGGAISANNSTINLSGNAKITNNSVTAESANWALSEEEKKGAHGGAFYIEEKSNLNISENVEISGNTCVMYGGGIFSWNSTINVTGGKISNNKALKGAGLYCEEGSNLNLNKGEISTNEAKLNDKLTDYNENIGGIGGGVMAVGSPVTILEGFNILSNKAEIDGGGIELLNTTLTMNGGKIDGNIAGINGGGILISNGASANINAGYITNNNCDVTKFNFDFVNNPNAVLGTMETIGSGSEFVGGGIYLHAGCSLNISNPIITNNTNDQSAGINVYPDKTIIGYSGNGIVLCPTADVKIYGGAIYGNDNEDAFDLVLVPHSYVTDYNFSHNIDKRTSPKLYVSKFALGGGFYNWTDFEGNPVTTDEYDGSEIIALKSHLSNDEIEVAKENATVYITGNSSKGIYGAGGIMCNGTLTIGKNDFKVGNLTVSKNVEGSQKDKEKSFTFTVTLGNKNINGVYGDMTFKDGIATITLKHGESKVAKGLPANINYEVEEKEDKDFDITSTEDKGNIIENSNIQVLFTNKAKNGGISQGILPQTGSKTMIIVALLIISTLIMTISTIKLVSMKKIGKF